MNASPHQIALIEDAESDVLLIREAMEQAGLKFQLHVLSDGEEALEFITGIENDEAIPVPRLIILDLNLPKVSGGQVLEWGEAKLTLCFRSGSCSHLVGLAQG